MDLQQYMQEKKEIIDHFLQENLPAENQNPSKIHQAMRYSVLNGGKRIRPILTFMTAELFGLAYQKVLLTACGIELIHTFSLIHDDLPCMDNDDYRRGKLTNHKVFGEAMAILAGDALLVLGIDFIRKNAEVVGISSQSVMDVLQEILDMLGTGKMLGGQVDDISWQNQEGNPNYIREIYLKKTSALICSSLKAGGILAQATPEQIQNIHIYGENIGLAFQIIDDLLDLEQDQEEKDQPTFPEIFGIEESKKEAQRLCLEAKACLISFGVKAQLFHELADFVLYRKK